MPSLRLTRGLAAVLVFVLVGCAGSRDAGRSETPSTLAASSDPDVIARGRYLAYGPAHCVACHTPEGPQTAFAPGEAPPLIGGFAFRFPGGRIAAPNLTPDPETGIGSRTDAELVRMLRHNVRADGSRALPIMEYQNLTDEDVVALLSFLRSQPPVRHEVDSPRMNLVARAGLAVVAPKTRPRETGPTGGGPGAGTDEPSVERGAYLAHDVAACASCHTRRSRTGAYRGPRLAGGFAMPVEGDPEHVLVTPNLTPDPETGALSGVSEDQFVARFRTGPAVPGSHMPWYAYATLSETDLRSIFRYLQSVPPVRRETRPTLREK